MIISPNIGCLKSTKDLIRQLLNGTTTDATMNAVELWETNNFAVIMESRGYIDLGPKSLSILGRAELT